MEVTNACNLDCAFCAGPGLSRREPAHMPMELFKSAAAQAGDLAEMLSPHLLGEPLLHPEFPALLGCCSELGLKVNLVTNGLLLDNYPQALFAEPCLAQVSISLHALACLPPAERAAALAGLVSFARARPAGLTVGFRLRSGERDGFHEEILKGLLSSFKAGLAPGTDFVKLAPGVFLNFGPVFDWPGGSGGAGKTGCLGLRHHFGVLSDGRVVPCCADYDGRLALGDLREKPLKEILAGPRAEELRRSFTGSAAMPAYCASCGFTPPDAG